MPEPLNSIPNPREVLTPIDSAIKFPEILDRLYEKYNKHITLFCQMVDRASSSAELLKQIRSNNIPSDQRMALLKIFRRCVSPIMDTETTKKINSIRTEDLVSAYGATFKPIDQLKNEFVNLSEHQRAALAALIGEYDTRGQQGYQLAATFFDWFENKFLGAFTIEGPRSAGPDIELRTIYPKFKESYPCDFVIRDSLGIPKVVGFIRYDATRGGSQSDDRTGGNSNKVGKAREFCLQTGHCFRILFVADGPGLAHRDTWEEACNLDGSWNGNVRVTTLKLADKRVTHTWLSGLSD